MEQAHWLLVSGGRVMVEDFAWPEIDPVTAEWFYSNPQLLYRCNVIIEHEGSFAAYLLRSDGSFASWQHSHDHDMHGVSAMWSTLRTLFQSISEGSMPYLYRYLCPVLAENED